MRFWILRPAPDASLPGRGTARLTARKAGGHAGRRPELRGVLEKLPYAGQIQRTPSRSAEWTEEAAYVPTHRCGSPGTVAR